MQEAVRIGGGEEQIAPPINNQWLNSLMGKLRSFEDMQAQLGVWMREILDR